MSKVTLKRRYWLNGQPWSEIPYNTSKQKNGIAKWYYTSGQLKCEVSYVNGKRHGITKWYHENGQSKCEILYVNARRHGIIKWHSESGQLQTIEYYWYGKVVTKKQWDNIPRLVKLLNRIGEDE